MLKKYSDLKISTRMLFGFGLLIFLMIMIGILAISEMKKLSSLTDKMYRHPFTVSNAVLKIDGYIIAMHRSMKDVALADNIKGIKKASNTVDQFESKIINKFKIVDERFLGDKKMVLNALQSFKDWKKIRDEVITFMKQGKRAEAAKITKEKGARHVAELNRYMNSLITFATNKAFEFNKNAANTRDFTINLMLFCIAVSVLLAIGLVSFISKNINKNLLNVHQRAIELSNSAKEMSQNTEQGKIVAEEVDSLVLELCNQGT
jgi:methyl-accepting chemotaxis protein